MAIQGRALRRGPQPQPDVAVGLSRLYDAGFNTTGWSRKRGGYSRRRPWGAIIGAVVIVAVGAGVLVTRVEWTSLDVAGIAEDAELGRKDLERLALRVEASGPAAGDVRIELNGTEIPASPAKRGKGSNGSDRDDRGGDEVLIADRAALVDAVKPGKNTLVVTLDGRAILGGEEVERTFSFDPSGPELMVPAQAFDRGDGGPVTIRGLVERASSLTANGQPLALEPGGLFTFDVASGATEVDLVARDAEGNPERATIPVSTEPLPVAYPETAAVHIAASDWANPMLRQQVIDLAEAGRINAVQLDIKDEAGEVAYESDVALASKIGAAQDYYDPQEAIETLHGLGVRVIGRIVCFLDPVMAQWAAANSRSDMIVLDGSGTVPLESDYGEAAFTSLASAEVRDYQMDLADEAVAYGFDEILYDYVRRPEGDLSTMAFEGLESTPEVAIARFVAETNERLDGTDAALGVSVFGIASTRPEQMAQDISLLAPHVDYVAPMVYPSHWGEGEFGVADPVRQPGDIVGASVKDFVDVAAGSGAAIVPWLQDFDSGTVLYGEQEVRAQIDAARYNGAKGYLLWNPSSEITTGALDVLDEG